MTAESEVHVPSIDELIELPEVTDPQISPDGRHVVYTVRTPDWQADEYRSQLWLAGAGPGDAAPRQLTFAAASSQGARWSPDGQWLAFLSKRPGDEHTQIYRLCPWGGEAERLAALENDATALAWLPGGQALAYIAVDAEGADRQARRERFGDFRVIDEDWPPYSHLWLLPLADRRPQRLTAGAEFHVVEMVVSPDGQKIAFTGSPTPEERDQDRTRIHVVDIATLAVTALTDEGCMTPRWSPDGREIAYLAGQEPTYIANLRLLALPAPGAAPAAGATPRALAEGFDEIPMPVDWQDHGLYFLAQQGTDWHLFCAAGSGQTPGAFRQVTPVAPRGWVSPQASVARTAQRAALVWADGDHYTEIACLDLDTGALRVLTNNNSRIADWALGHIEVLRWTSGDGTEIEGVVTLPPGFNPAAPGEPRPLLVLVHGGPVDAAMCQRLPGYDRHLYPATSWLARGALILKPNYRGSSGRGEAFRRLPMANLGLGDYEDVISGVDALVARGWADPERVGVMGWSEGGFISAFVATYDRRARAVSVGAGPSDWLTYYVTTDIQPFTRQYLGVTPWDDPDIYRRTSPMGYINQAATPALIQHGENDRRVPVANAYELHQGLLDRGVETRMVVYPGMPHGPQKPRTHRQLLQDNLDWFNRHIWGDAAPEREPAPCYVVFCSAQKRDDAGLLPAIARYDSERIRKVQEYARRDRAAFRIFSGQYGLVTEDQPLPWYDHVLAPEEVSAMAARVAEQLKAEGLRRMVIYTQDLARDPAALIYLGCLQVAAGAARNVTIEQRLANFE